MTKISVQKISKTPLSGRRHINTSVANWGVCLFLKVTPIILPKVKFYRRFLQCDLEDRSRKS